MFFFIAGVEPTIRRTLQSNIGTCQVPYCGNTVHLVEVANTFKLLFVPIWSFAPKQLVYCNTCRYLGTQTEFSDQQWAASRITQYSIRGPCQACGTPIQRDWCFCPNCGRDMDLAMPDLS
eukprot:scaffold13078_cov48-Attheya_sp.AAC.7